MPHLSGGDGFLLHSLHKCLQSYLRRVVWNLMSSTKYSQEAEVARRLECASLLAINSVWGETLAGKGRRRIVIDLVCDVVITLPVADEIGVASPDEDLNAGLDD